MISTKKIEQLFFVLRDVIAIGIALAVSFLLIASVSTDPMGAIATFLFGPLRTVSRLGYIVEKMIPLMFTGVAVCIMFSGNQINMGGEGAFYLGGVVATAVAILPIFPAGVHPVLSILAAGLTGMVICGLTAVFHVRFHSMTIVTSLMFNYICLYLGQFLINRPLWDSSAGFQASYRFASTSLLPKLFSRTNIHAGLFIAILVVVFGSFLINRSTFGYQIRAVGKNQNFARYSGMNVSATIIGCQLVGGFLAGAGGAVEQLGMYTRFQYPGLSGHGFDGVMLAVIAGYNPKYIPLAGFFLAYVRVGAEAMARMSDVPTEVISIVQSIIIMFIVAEKFLSQWKHQVIVNNSMKLLKKTGA